MLRFQSHPDKIFTAILEDSIQLTMDEIIDAVRMAESQEEANENIFVGGSDAHIQGDLYYRMFHRNVFNQAVDS